MKQDDAGAGRIDWAQVHGRLSAAATSLEARLNPTLEAQRATLRERARVLARETRAKDERLEAVEVVEFILGYERYAIESRYVREIYPLREFAALPGAPAFVLGLVNIRGRILSVIDIKKFFELPDKGISDLNKVIVLQVPPMEVGILADAIIGIRSIFSQDLLASLPTLTGIRADYLRGVTREPLAVLDAAKLLSDPRIIVNEDVESAT